MYGEESIKILELGYGHAIPVQFLSLQEYFVPRRFFVYHNCQTCVDLISEKPYGAITVRKMSIPKYPEFYPYILKHTDEPKTTDELLKIISLEMDISEEDLAVRQPSGEKKVRNRLGWAIWDLRSHYGLIETVSRGIYVITEKGKEVRQKHGMNITKPILDNEYKDNPDDTVKELTPTDMIENATSKLRMEVKTVLLENILEKDPYFFEELVVKLLKKMGYGTEENLAETTGKSHDEGIDGIIYQDKLGFDAIYIQAKKWKDKTPVGRDELQKFAGALLGKKAQKGVFITTSSFSGPAKNYARQQKIRCIDGQALADLMINYEVGTKVAHEFNVYEIDEDFFSE